MLMTSLPGIPRPPSSPAYDPDRQKTGEFAIAARMLLDGLRESRARLDTAIQLLTHLSRQPPPHVPENYVEVAAKVRKVLADIGRVSARSQGDR
jgi:hypothetical protein